MRVMTGGIEADVGTFIRTDLIVGYTVRPLFSRPQAIPFGFERTEVTS